MLKTVLIVAVIVVAIGIGGFIYLGQSSKNGSAPGLVGGTLAPCPDKPNCVSSEAGTAPEKAVDPFAPDAWDRVPGALEAMGAAITVQQDNYIAAEFTSPTFGFVDDLELRKSERGVEVRSASRVGYSDAGANAKRVDALRAQLTQ